MVQIATPLEQGGSVIRVALPAGLHALIDAVDVPLVEQHRWALQARGARLYAYTAAKGPKHAMHRLILDAPRELDVDHINGDGLDNRRANLRLATRSQNTANTGPGATNRSGYKGVCFRPSRGKWEATIRVDGRQRFLGRFTDPWEAAQAYNAAALATWGEFAYLNERVA